MKFSTEDVKYTGRTSFQQATLLDYDVEDPTYLQNSTWVSPMGTHLKTKKLENLDRTKMDSFV